MHVSIRRQKTLHGCQYVNPLACFPSSSSSLHLLLLNRELTVTVMGSILIAGTLTSSSSFFFLLLPLFNAACRADDGTIHQTCLLRSPFYSSLLLSFRVIVPALLFSISFPYLPSFPLSFFTPLLLSSHFLHPQGYLSPLTSKFFLSILSIPSYPYFILILTLMTLNVNVTLPNRLTLSPF